MWNTFLGKHITPLSAEVVLALIPSRICSYQFRNRLDNLTLRNTMAVTFKLVAIKNRCLWFTQLYIVPVIRSSYLLFIVHLLVSIIRYYSFSILFVVRLFCSIFIWVLFWLLFKRKRTILNLNSVQVFRSRKEDYLQYISTWDCFNIII